MIAMAIKWKTKKWMNKIDKCKIDKMNAKLTYQMQNIW
jgi:hypothetical protein